ncbi:MAG: hypothetical protein H3C47_11710 [Candidatus Cloacimonetes bacterium]|nr:hypothetical protein [Candidatus Cloacimonadota bacterium]
MLKIVIAVCLALCPLYHFEHARSLGFANQYYYSYNALFNASTVQSLAEWQDAGFHYNTELLSYDRGCDKLIIVDSLEDFVSKSFPGCEQNPAWGGFVLYPEKNLARFNFPFSGKNIFSDKIHWGHLNVWTYSFVHYPPVYFPLNNRLAIHGLSFQIDDLEDLESKINDPQIYEKAKIMLFGPRGLEFLRNPPSTALRKVRDKDQVTIICDPVTDFIGFIRPDGSPISVHSSPHSLKHKYKTNLEYFHAQ